MLGIGKKKGEEGGILPKRMAELLLTRYSHDIAGPISAVANGLDFLMNDAKDSDDPGGVEIRNQAVDLVEDSAKQSLARLQAFRAAYGVVYSRNIMTNTTELIDIFKRFFLKSQIELRWNSSVPKEITAHMRRMCASMILTHSRVLIYGGKISVSFSGFGDTKNKITVKATAKKFKEPVVIKQILEASEEVEPDVENIPYFFIRALSQEVGVEDLEFDYVNNEDEKIVHFSVTFQDGI